MDSPASKRVLACIRCKDKRVKCNRQKPCATCIKHNVDCEYRLRKPRAKRNGTHQNEDEKSMKQTGVSDENASGLNTTEQEKDDSPCQISALLTNGSKSISSEPQTTVFKPQLLQGQDSSRLVNNSLWSRIAEEVHSEEDSAEEALATRVSRYGFDQDDYSYALGSKSIETKLEHPSSSQIRQLWQIFVDNVDPLLKITHIPTLQPSIEKAILNVEHIPKGFEALMFSIYSIAVVSITDDQCRKLTGESRAHAVEHYIAATRSALVRARFMSSTSLVVMQALTLHIFSIRQSSEPRAVWNLTGLAWRIAQGMGLCIDGGLLGLSPFETEIRRRIWWQLKSHDFRAAELCGQAKFQQFELDETTPKIPANVNDSDLYPSMTKPPGESKRATEMSWNVLRSDLSTFAYHHKLKVKNRKMKEPETGLTSEEYSALDNLAMKDELSDEIEEFVETKYLRFCDPSKPLELLLHLGARCATDYIRFVAHHPRRWAHQKEVLRSEKQLVWTLCLQILDRTMMIQTMPQLQRFAWIIPYFVQWPTVIHILDTLRMEPNHQDAPKAWKLIDLLYEHNIEMLLMRRPIFAAVGSLCLKAHQTRMHAKSQSVDVPEYIARLKNRYKKSQDRGDRTALSKEMEDGRYPKYLQQSSGLVDATVDRQPSVAVSTTQHNDDFWLSNDFDWLTAASDTQHTFDMDIDGDGFLSTNKPSDSMQGAAINWEQWDAWLGNCQSL